jgi:hypothetical protein
MVSKVTREQNFKPSVSIIAVVAITLGFTIAPRIEICISQEN